MGGRTGEEGSWEITGASKAYVSLSQTPKWRPLGLDSVQVEGPDSGKGGVLAWDVLRKPSYCHFLITLQEAFILCQSLCQESHIPELSFSVEGDLFIRIALRISFYPLNKYDMWLVRLGGGNNHAQPQRQRLYLTDLPTFRESYSVILWSLLTVLSGLPLHSVDY